MLAVVLHIEAACERVHKVFKKETFRLAIESQMSGCVLINVFSLDQF